MKLKANWLQLCVNVVLPLLMLWTPSSVAQDDATYQDATNLVEQKFGTSSSYSTIVRPRINQSEPVVVNFLFSIVAILEVNALEQKFIINGFMSYFWRDESLTWNLNTTNIEMLHPEPKQIWRPRVIVTNTLGDRDLFKDIQSPVQVEFDGSVSWFPGSLFPTSCKLNLKKYPFDVQECSITMISNGLQSTEIEFVALSKTVSMANFVESGEWKIEETIIEACNRGCVPGDDDGWPRITITFKLRRLPGFFIVNIVAPIILLSALNILVFMIPVDSGEKISYGITVLLALSVFVSIVSEQLPRTSDTLPLVTIYLLILTCISVCTVVASVIIVYFHHKDERDSQRKRAMINFKSIVNKFTKSNQGLKSAQVEPENGLNPKSKNKLKSLIESMPTNNGNNSNSNNNDSSNDSSSTQAMAGFDKLASGLKSQRSYHAASTDEDEKHSDKDYWRALGKHIDFICFIVFSLVWIVVTIGFIIELVI